MSLYKNAFNNSPKSKGKTSQTQGSVSTSRRTCTPINQAGFPKPQINFDEGIQTFASTWKSPSGAPSSETPVKKLTKKEAERLLLVEGIHKSIANCLRRTRKYDETFSVFLRHQEFTTNIDSYHAKSFQRVRKLWGCSESTYLQSFASMENSITKIGSTAYKSTDGKFPIY